MSDVFVTTAAAMSTVPHVEPLYADSSWRTVEVISDLHLQASEPLTVQAWQQYLATSQADAIFILGDLFEVWVGDDAIEEAGSFEAQCVEVLRAAALKRPMFFMAGNRDFLVGELFAQRTGLQLMHDPSVLIWNDRRIVLSHGDALCLDDVEYQKFRALSRSPAWQQQLLSQPLAVRRAIGKNARSESESQKQSGAIYADADPAMTQSWMDAAQAQWLVHGHTHRPADHAMPCGRTRIVLSDWHIDAEQQRAQILRLTPSSWERVNWLSLPPPV